MTARTPLIPLDDALTELLAQARPLAGVDTVSTFDADGRVLAQAAISPLQVPQQDNSAMDGYALRCADVAAAGVELRVSQRIAAGDSGQPLLPGTAARIFTGAPVPAGADAVVMQEDCEALDDGQRVRINHLPSPGQAIRRAGEDITLGAQVLAAGTRLTPAELGLAASIGLAQLQVALRPRVALFSTGDELVMPGEVAPAQMRPGAIYNSNRFFLRAMLQRLGCVVTDMGVVPDRLDATVAALRDAFQNLPATVRASLRAGGEPIRRHWREPGERLRRLVVLLDISGSMEPYARAMLRFVHAAVSGRQRVEAFAIGTRLTRMTKELHSRDPDTALAAASTRVHDWSGGTRLGDCLRTFNDQWGVRGMARGAIVVILSDGWDRGDPQVLADQMQRLQRITYQTVWVNPLKVTPGYAPLARGMAAALPFVDDFVEGHSLAAMQELARVIANAAPRRSHTTTGAR